MRVQKAMSVSATSTAPCHAVPQFRRRRHPPPSLPPTLLHTHKKGPGEALCRSAGPEHERADASGRGPGQLGRQVLQEEDRAPTIDRTRLSLPDVFLKC